MSDSKCFCHLGEYQVKDAQARADIEDLKESIADLEENGVGTPGADGADGKDGISVTHSWDGSKLTLTSASGTNTVDLRGPEGTAPKIEIKNGYWYINDQNTYVQAQGVNGTSVTASMEDTVLTISSATGTYSVDLEGQAGEDGESAYDIACRVNGFEGTEEEWLESLKGANGSVDNLKIMVITLNFNYKDKTTNEDKTTYPVGQFRFGILTNKNSLDDILPERSNIGKLKYLLERKIEIFRNMANIFIYENDQAVKYPILDMEITTYTDDSNYTIRLYRGNNTDAGATIVGFQASKYQSSSVTDTNAYLYMTVSMSACRDIVC